jgi:hypothetical protein
MGHSRRPVTSLEYPRSSFPLVENVVLGVSELGGLRVLSQSAIAIFILQVSSLRASFAPDCN